MFKMLAGYGLWALLYDTVFATLPHMAAQRNPSQTRDTLLSVDLKDLKQPWLAWCQTRGLTSSEALRQLLTTVTRSGAAPSSPSASPRSPLRPHPPRRERPTRPLKVRLTASEHLALSARARRDGLLPGRWLIALLRTYLTEQPSLSQAERETLARSNQQLLALGRNLNQIAKALHTSPAAHAAFRVEVIDALSQTIRAHVAHVTALTRANLDRWELR